nr:probable protein S-acyltransferase 12 isoform X2 [Ipomoea batatas]GME21273.1 probable protein S-acyltransferase 12 isoform X2 [Ipomoea batatas]
MHLLSPATPLQWRFMKRKEMCDGSMTWGGNRILCRFLGVARHCGFCHYSQRKIWRASLHCMGWSSRHARMRISDPAKVTCMPACLQQN